MRLVFGIAITVYSSNWLGWKTAKEPFGFRIKLPPAHLFITHGGGFTLFLFIAVRQSEKLGLRTSFYNLYIRWFDPAEKRTRVYCLSSRRSIHSTTADWLKSVFSVTLKDDFRHEKNRESL